MYANTRRPLAPIAAIIPLVGLLLLSAGCKTTSTDQPHKPDTKIPPTAGVQNLPPAPPLTGTSPFAAGVPAPDSVVAVVGAKSIRSVGNFAQMAVSAANPNSDEAIDAESMVLEGMGGLFGWSDTSWVNLDGPMYVMVLKGKEKVMLAVPVGNYAAALESMPETPGMDIGNHVRGYRHRGANIYVDTVGRHIILTTDDADFDNMKGMLPKIITWRPTGVLTGYVAPKSLGTLMGVDLDELIKNLPALLELGETTTSVMDPRAIADFFGKLINETELVRLSVTQPKVSGSDYLGAEFGLIPVPGSDLSKFLQFMAQSKVPMPTMMPPQSWFGTLMDLDIRNVKSLVTLDKSFTKAAADQLLKISGKKAAARYIANSDLLRKAMTGKGLVALHADQGFPLAAVSMQPIDMDGKAFRKLYNQMLEDSLAVYWPDVLASFNEVGLKDFAKKFKKFNLKKLLKFANKQMTEVGLRFKMVKGKHHDALVLEPTKLKGKAANDRDVTAIHDVLRAMGGQVEMAVAFGPKAVAFGFGPSGIANAQALANGRGMGGSPIARNLSLDTAVMGFFNIGEFISAIKGIPMIGGMLPLPDAPKDKAMLIGVRSDGKEATISYLMPMEYVSFLQQIANL